MARRLPLPELRRIALVFLPASHPELLHRHQPLRDPDRQRLRLPHLPAERRLLLRARILKRLHPRPERGDKIRRKPQLHKPRR